MASLQDLSHFDPLFLKPLILIHLHSKPLSMPLLESVRSDFDNVPLPFSSLHTSGWKFPPCPVKRITDSTNQWLPHSASPRITWNAGEALLSIFQISFFPYATLTSILFFNVRLHVWLALFSDAKSKSCNTTFQLQRSSLTFSLWFLSILYELYKHLYNAYSVQFSSVTQPCPTLCKSMNHQHTRPPCPSPTLEVYPDLCPLSRWCHLTISSSVIPFSSCPQSFPASQSFQMSQLFASGGQNIGISALTSVLPMNTQDWSPLGWTGWISLQSKGLSRVVSNTTVQKHQFFCAQLSL